MSELPKSAAEAREVGAKFYFDGISCRNGHVANRRTSNRDCVVCMRDRGRRHTENNRALRRAVAQERAAQRPASDLPNSAAEAREVGAKFYFTGRPCKRGHVAERYTRGQCVACNREDGPSRWRVWAERNPEHLLAYNQAYYHEHADTIKQRTREWAERNPDEAAEGKRLWKKRHPEKAASHAAGRHAALMSRRPRWLSQEHKQVIDALYAEARRLSQAMGEPYHVDHIVPLQGETVSGLHLPWNLRVIPGVENCRKSNKFIQGLES